MKERKLKLCLIKHVFNMFKLWCEYPASRGYIFAVWDGERKVASSDNRSIFYRACAKFVTRFASNWFVKSAWVSRESKLRKLLANNSPRAFVLFFCFAPSGFKCFSRQISSDRLLRKHYATNCSKSCLIWGEQFFFRLIGIGNTHVKEVFKPEREIILWSLG